MSQNHRPDRENLELGKKDSISDFRNHRRKSRTWMTIWSTQRSKMDTTEPRETTDLKKMETADPALKSVTATHLKISKNSDKSTKTWTVKMGASCSQIKYLAEHSSIFFSSSIQYSYKINKTTTNRCLDKKLIL